MNSRQHLFPPFAFQYKGGGGAPAQVAPPALLDAPAPVAAPVTAAPIIQAPPAPAASFNSPETIQARVDAQRASARRRGLNSTILAGAPGETGTLGGGGSGKNVLLGGG